MDERDYEAMNKKDSFDWNKFAIALKDEFGETIIDEGDEDNPLDWFLIDVTVSDIVDFVKKYRQDNN
jgi:hypothetical protein